jgi:hypothetical protein
MDPSIRKSPIDIIYNYAKAGLIHSKRWCGFCGTKMRLIKTKLDYLGYVWVCPVCYSGGRIN